MNGVLLWIAGLVVVLLGSLFAVPYAIDWNSYRGVFEEEASRMLGREVRVGGDVSVRLLPVPYVSFERPRIADTGIGEAFIRADSFTIWLGLHPLVQGIFEAKQVELKRPVLRLQIDKQGSGNWQQFSISRGSLPFVPRGLALQSVKMNEGVVSIHGVDGEQLARLEIAEGELAAPSLEGPYRFRADVRVAGELREIRGSTATPDGDGSVRLKLAVRSPQSPNAYAFDGRLIDLTTRPRIEGEVTASVAAAMVNPVAARRENPQGRTFDVRASLSADTLGARLGDVAFSFEQDGRPQLLTGSADMSWRGRKVLNASLVSRWLDLDRIAGTSGEIGAFGTARQLATALIGILPAQTEVSARIAIDQANLAGDIISNVAVAVQDAGRGLQISELRAGLPGGSRMDFTGAVLGAGAPEGLEGDVLLRGPNLGRFLGWAARGHPLANARGDSSFSVSARLRLTGAALDIREAVAEAGANRMTGDFSYRWDGRRQLNLVAETAHADVSAVLQGSLGTALATAMRGLGAGIQGPSPGPAEGLVGTWHRLLPGMADLDARFRVRADVLTDGVYSLTDVDTELVLQNGNLSLRRLRAGTPAGFELDLDGDVRDIAGQPKGSLRGTVVVQAPDAMMDVLALTAVDSESAAARALSRLAPMRLAFGSRFGAEGKSATEISIDGMVLGEQFAGTLSIDGGLAAWRTSAVDVFLVSDSAQVARLAYALATGHREVAVKPPVTTEQGRFLAKVVGVPSQELASVVELSHSDLRLAMRIRGRVGDGSALSYSGDMEVAAPDAGRALVFAGLKPSVGAARLPLNGTLGTRFADGRLSFSASRFAVGDAFVSGEAVVSGRAGERRVDATLRADDVAFSRLLGAVLDSDGATAAPSGNEHWREEPFDFTNFEQFAGRISLQTDALTLEEGVGISNAKVEIDIEPGRITVSKLEGQALGGAVSSAIKIEKGAAGASVSGVVGLFDLRLEKVVGAADVPAVAGRANVNLHFSGQAVSPRSLVAVLTGKGELELKGARVERLSPSAIETTADAVLAGRIDSGSEALRAALRKALAEGPLPVGNRKILIELGEAALRLRDFVVDTPKALVSNRTTIDLSEWKIDSEWKFEPKAAPRPRHTPIPGISVIYVGPLASYASLEPRIIFDSLERELAVRRMERDVEQLERLRREDEARAKAEAERLKAIEQQQLQHMRAPAPPTIDVPFPVPGAPQPGWAPAPPMSGPPPSGVEPKQGQIDPPLTGGPPSAGPVDLPPPVPPAPRPAPRRPPNPAPWDNQWPSPSGS